MSGALERTEGPGEKPDHLRLRQILLWQAAVLFVLAVGLGTSGRGSTPSLLGGGGVMAASLVLQRFAVAAALRRGRRSGLALLLLLAKLGIVLGVVWLGFRTTWLGPLSFAAGATSLPVAIVLDVCYPRGSSRERGEPPPPEDI